MKTALSTCLSLMTSGVLAAAEFPYGTEEMSLRYSGDDVVVSSYESVSVQPVGGGMPKGDSLVTFYASVPDFIAADETWWTDVTNAVGDAQAALAVRFRNGAYSWMAYAEGGWTELSAAGVAADDNGWEACIDIDYSLGVGNEKVRYSVRRPGDPAYVPLANVGGETWIAAGGAKKGVERAVENVQLGGFGKVDTVRLLSGSRLPSGTVVVTEDKGPSCRKLALDISVEDAWNVNGVTVALSDLDGNVLAQTNAVLVAGRALADFSQWVSRGERYFYSVELLGNYRGQDLVSVQSARSVAVAEEANWFSYAGGEFARATPVGIIVSDGKLMAPEQTPRGSIVPDSFAPENTVRVVLASTLVVSGAVQEEKLGTLDVSGAKGALTVVRFDDGSRGWACRTAVGGWTRLHGADAANGIYDVRIAVEYGVDGSRMAVWVAKEGADGTRLSDADGKEWLVVSASADLMRRVGLLGGGVRRLTAGCDVMPSGSGLVIYVAGNKRSAP